jgi:hypothetical protein
MSTSPLSFAFIENDFLLLDYLTPTGLRSVGPYAVETVRRINKQLSLKSITNGETNGKQN